MPLRVFPPRGHEKTKEAKWEYDKIGSGGGGGYALLTRMNICHRRSLLPESNDVFQEDSIEVCNSISLHQDEKNEEIFGNSKGEIIGNVGDAYAYKVFDNIPISFENVIQEPFDKSGSGGAKDDYMGKLDDVLVDEILEYDKANEAIDFENEIKLDDNCISLYGERVQVKHVDVTIEDVGLHNGDDGFSNCLFRSCNAQQLKRHVDVQTSQFQKLFHVALLSFVEELKLVTLEVDARRYIWHKWKSKSRWTKLLQSSHLASNQDACKNLIFQLDGYNIWMVPWLNVVVGISKFAGPKGQVDVGVFKPTLQLCLKAKSRNKDAKVTGILKLLLGLGLASHVAFCVSLLGASIEVIYDQDSWVLCGEKACSWAEQNKFHVKILSRLNKSDVIWCLLVNDLHIGGARVMKVSSSTNLNGNKFFETNVVYKEIRQRKLVFLLLADAIVINQLEMKWKSNIVYGRVQSSLFFGYHVKFRNYVRVLGSTSVFGPWKKEIQIKWKDTGWECILNCKGSVIIKIGVQLVDENKVWEVGLIAIELTLIIFVQIQD
ncbi:hypothetical protein QVD17_34903 [Tagetes erecta]|uniref:Uncharacterized protein n=1 Tax=Tagetes erecta TaxID=13708 RepID=A0AAD8K144_TARER|nr:hypothetical protein QVD17_34903 [Tagetes erecta]